MPRLVGCPTPSDALRMLLSRQDGVVRLDQLREAGHDWNAVRRMLGHSLVPLGHSTYRRCSPEPPTPRQLVRGALLAVPGSAACLSAAAIVHGLQGSRRPPPVHLLCPPSATRAQAGGVRLHWYGIAEEELTTVDGMAVTTIERTVFDLVRTSDQLGAVSVGDSALHRQLLTVHELAEVRDRLAARASTRARGCWLDRCDGRAESPLESRGRIILTDAGLPPDDLQTPVERGAGREPLRLDMSWSGPPRWGGEADGAEHHDPAPAVYADLDRMGELGALGWPQILHYIWRDTLPHGIPGFLARFRANIRP